MSDNSMTQSFFDISSVPACVISKKGHIQCVNKAWEQRFECSEETLLGELLPEQLYRGDRHYVQEHIASLSPDKNEAIFEGRYVTATKDYAWVRFGIVLNEEQNVIFVTAMDISELKESQERLETVFKATQDGIWELNLNTKEVWFSENWKAMLGYSDDDFPNEIASWEKVVYPDDKEATLAHIYACANEGTPYCETVRYLHKDGTLRYVMCRGYALGDKREAMYRMIGAHTDISDLQI